MVFSTQKFAGSLRDLHKGWQAGTADGMKKAIALTVPVDVTINYGEDTVPYSSPVTPVNVLASPS